MRPIQSSLFILAVFLMTVTCSYGCDNGDEPEFGIYLTSSDELVLSGHHIVAYYEATHTIELNVEGIDKWNSYMTYNAIPTLDQTLYGKEFVVKVGDESVYSGAFWSMASSIIPDGIIVSESLFKLDETHNTIQIQLGHPNPQNANAGDPRNNSKVLSYFKKHGLLK